MRRAGVSKRAGVWFSASCLLAVLFGVPLGCGADDKFSEESFDEYTEPLADAVIGTPDGVITVAPNGTSQTAAVPAASGGKAGAGSTDSAGSPGFAGGPAAGGSGGTGGSVGTGGIGIAGSGGGFGEAGTADPGAGGGFGFWHFDDCSTKSHFLADSSGFGANAQQALKADCVAGISGQGVHFRSAKDIVQVPDEPQFTVDQRVGVAAWVNPKTVTGDQPIVIKRLNNKTAFSLGIHNGNIEMSVVLSGGKTVISRAPIKPNVWTHVAGMYDGTFVFLFINGQQFGQVFAAGTVRDVFAPIRIGATTGTQFFNGVIDDVFLTTQAISASTLTALACVARPSTFSVSPSHGGPVPADTNVRFDVSVSNNDVGACGSKQYDAFVNSFDPGITANFDDPGQFQSAAPGTALKFAIEVSGSDDADPGVHTLPLVVDAFGRSFEQLDGQLSFELSAPTGCFVTTRKELMITNPSVVDDPVRTAGSIDPGGFGTGGGGGLGNGGEAGAVFAEAGDSGQVGGSSSTGSGGSVGGPKGAAVGAGGSAGSGASGSGNTAGSGGSGGGAPAGVWSFGSLMRQMAPTVAQAPAMTLQLFQHWLTNQTVNGFTVTARPQIQQALLDIWPKTASGELDLDRSPLTLQAIVNRIDTRNLSEGSAGEGRFVFGVNGNANFQQFTVILEYNLPAKTQQEVLNWANRWHALASHPFPSEEYNAALEAVTRLFTDRGAQPGNVNGSALVELRTNEIALSFDGRWELRSFVLSQASGFFDETTVKETPDLSFNGSQTFANFVNQNATAIIAEVPGANSHTVPEKFSNASFLAGSIFNDQIQWNAPGIKDPDARFHASLNTCNGCHGPDTNTFNFLMVTARSPGGEAFLSPFLTGTTVFDRFSGQTRTLNDLQRRKTDLTGLVCASTLEK